MSFTEPFVKTKSTNQMNKNWFSFYVYKMFQFMFGIDPPLQSQMLICKTSYLKLRNVKIFHADRNQRRAEVPLLYQWIDYSKTVSGLHTKHFHAVHFYIKKSWLPSQRREICPPHSWMCDSVSVWLFSGPVTHHPASCFLHTSLLVRDFGKSHHKSLSRILIY